MDIVILRSDGVGIYLSDGDVEPIFLGGGITESDAITHALDSLADAVRQIEELRTGQRKGANDK